jgi:carbon storage regulator
MLVLSRRLGQQFQVGSDIQITIVKIDRHSVRVGIEAPHDVAIVRREISFDEGADDLRPTSRRSDAA